MRKMGGSFLVRQCRHLSFFREAIHKCKHPSSSVRSLESSWESSAADPWQLWHNRPIKKSESPKYPAFKHATTGDSWWLLDSQHAWVEGRLRPEKDIGAYEASYQPGINYADGCEDAGRVGRYAEHLNVQTLSKHCEVGRLSEAVEALDLLVQQRCHVDHKLFYGILKRCMANKDLVLGRQVHALATQSGYEANAFLANHIICMYACHGRLEEAMHAFTKVTAPNSHMWASIILAHARHGQPTRAIELYREMRQSSLRPDNHMFVAVLKACATARDLASGKEVHADILGSLDGPDTVVGNCLVDMYAKCGNVGDARRVFDNLSTKNVVTSTAMITGYAKCGRLEEARQVFDVLPTRDVVTWNAMIAGYAEHGFGQEALALYADMLQNCKTPANHSTFVSLLQSCANVGALQLGKKLHAQILKRGMETNVVIGTCLVDMYAKCGSLEDARRVFDKLPTRDVVAWNALLHGYAEHTHGKMVMQCFEEMCQQGVQPNDSTFISLLVACSHAGLVHEGRRYFKMMIENCSIVPTDFHYNCMIDLLGRSGHLDEAEDMLHTKPIVDYFVGLTSLLSACKTHGDADRGRRCFEGLVELEPENAVPYVLLASIYAKANRWSDVDNVERMRKSAGAKKKPAKACIEVNQRVHEFKVGEGRADISLKLSSVNSRVKEEGGHVPLTELVLKAVPEQEKEDALCGHAEKLALAYGLMNTADGTTLLVTKNLLMCNDCHSSTKIMSRLEKREIIVRDAHCVHHFLDGSCSCEDRY